MTEDLRFDAYEINLLNKLSRTSDGYWKSRQFIRQYVRGDLGYFKDLTLTQQTSLVILKKYLDTIIEDSCQHLVLVRR